MIGMRPGQYLITLCHLGKYAFSPGESATEATVLPEGSIVKTTSEVYEDRFLYVKDRRGDTWLLLNSEFRVLSALELLARECDFDCEEKNA